MVILIYHSRVLAISYLNITDDDCARANIDFGITSSDDQELREAANSISNEVQELFLKSASKYGLDLEKADFNFEIGTPRSFLEQCREPTISSIKEIEARPDSLHLQFVDGQVEIVAYNLNRA